VHAENWLEVGVRIVHTAFVITVDAQPVHGSANRHLAFAHNGNVVLSLAGDHAGVTTNASVQVDGHTPGILLYSCGGYSVKSGAGS
jgi:hypothetical protein